MDDNLSLTRRTQLKELEVLKVFQDLCRRHNLRYFAIGGTCLGAVRHKGFIPWDDDVDVAMPYEDYVKFCGIAETDPKLKGKYSILHHWHSKIYRSYTCHYFAKFFDTHTTFIENGNLDTPEVYKGIFIDIFPVHGLPKSNLAVKVISLLSTISIGLNMTMRMPFKLMPTTTRKIFWLLLSPFRLVLPFHFCTTSQEKFLSRYPFGCSDRIIFSWRRMKLFKETYDNIFPYELFKTSTDLPFEDTTISVPAGYDEYLRIEFNDYMKLPPKEKQISAHSIDAIIDLDRPYTYYVEKARGNS